MKVDSLFLATSVLTLPFMSQSVHARADSSDMLEEVVVTAQRREENIQNVPIAIVALNMDQLRAAGIVDTASLKQAVPGLDMANIAGVAFAPSIRGIGTTSGGPGVENPVATYVDGVYMASQTGALLSLNDIEQVAVLKGPQGTLFGRNATGGLVQITTRSPQHQATGDFHLTVGNLGTYGGDAFVTGPLSDTLAASISLYYNDQRDGFGKNLFNGQDVNRMRNYATSGKMRWTPTDETDVTLSVDFSDSRGAQPALTTLYGLDEAGKPHQGGPWDVSLSLQPYFKLQQKGASLTVQQDFDATRLLSITAYRRMNLLVRIDNDASALNYNNGNIPQADQQFSQELQLQSNGDGKLKWVTGVYYFRATAGFYPLTLSGPAVDAAANAINVNVSYAANLGFPLVVLPLGAQSLNVDVKQHTRSLAGFAQASYEIFDATNVTGGIRYTTDQRRFVSRQGLQYPNGLFIQFPVNPVTGVNSGYGNAKHDFSQTTYRLAVDHRFSPEAMSYVSFNTGFKSGLYNPQELPPRLIKAETLDAYEAGIKTDLFNHQVRLNLAAFYNEYSNVQVFYLKDGLANLANGSGSYSHGIDADLTWKVSPDLTLMAGLSWLDAHYGAFPNAQRTVPNANPAIPINFPAPPALPGPAFLGVPNVYGSILTSPYGNTVSGDFDAGGNKVQNAPEYTGNLGFIYQLPVSADLGRFALSANGYYNNGWFADPQNRLKQKSYELFDATVSWSSKDDAWNLRLWGRNLTNKAYATQMTASQGGDGGNIGPGRTFGVTGGFHF